MQEKLAVYPETTGKFVIARDSAIMTGFDTFEEAHSYALDILSGKEGFIKDLNLNDIKINRKGTRAVFLRTDNGIEERRYITEKDGSISIEQQEHPIRRAS